MKKISQFFIENSKFTLVVTIAILIMGIQGLVKMNSESFPSVNFAQAIVTTRYDGASASDVETKITKPIEDKIREVTGIKDVRSISQSGLSTIIVRGDMDNVDDVKEVMSDLQRAVDSVNDLPPDLIDDPTYLEIKSEEFPVLEIAVIGKNLNRRRDLIAELLKEEFEDSKKVKDVRLTGFAQRRFQIRLDHKKLNAYHIGVNEVLNKISIRNINVPGGSLKGTNTQTLLRLEGKIKNAEELGDILIRSNFTGKKVYLKDISSVEDSEEETRTKARYNGEEATLIVVSKKGGADTIALVKEINGTIDSFKTRYPDLKFEIYNNESKKVENRLNVLTSNAVSGLILVVVFLFIFLPGRIGLLASLSLPIAVMATVGIMPSYGMNLNAITILALVIALGMLVDNSVVISENFTRLREEGLSPAQAAQESVTSLWLPITATAFTTIAAFLPMLVTKGIMGQFIKNIPIVVTIALVISLFESFFLLPMRLVLGGGEIKKQDQSDKKDWFSKFQNSFEKFMRWCVEKRYFVSLLFIGVVATSIFFMTVANKFILFPPDQTEVYVARLKMDTGTPIEKTSHSIKLLSKDIGEALGKDVKHIVGRAGTSKVQMTDPLAQDADNVGMVMIYVTEDAKNNLNHLDALKSLRTISWKKYAKDVTFESMVNGPPVGNDIEATLRSNSNDDLTRFSNLIVKELEVVKGIRNLQVDNIYGDDEVYINIDYPKADQLGLDIRNIGDTVKAAVSGAIISDVTLNNKDIDLMVRFKEVFRKDIKDLKKIEVMDKSGNLVPLSAIASFVQSRGLPQVKRYDFKKSKTVTGSVDTDIITSMVANKQLKEIFDKHSKEFPTVSLVFGGAAESTNESMSSLFDALILSLIGIFALLVFLFKSFLRPAIIMTTIPLGLLGFSIAFSLHQRPISFLALIGIIGLGGIIVNSGIVLISFIDQMKSEGKLPLKEVLIKASGVRLKAVLVTSLTTISGLIPTAYGIGGTDAMLVPMTLAMAWGLTSGTILTLVWVPCAYAILEDTTQFAAKLMSKVSRKKNNINEEVVHG
jgi:multidrug efflux pump subunit AcrB